MNAPSDRSPLLDRQTGRSAFGAGAQDYHVSRSGYPPELFEYLSRRVVPSPKILELGAGTGLASEGLLLRNPAHLAIIEPDPRLCAFLESRFDNPNITIHPGSFPDVAISGPFDLVACAAAFHWMEPEPALARIASLLAPDGVWAMWWNIYLGHGEDDALANHAMAILKDEGIALPPSFGPTKHNALDVAAQSAMLHNAGFGDVEHKLFRSTRDLDPDQVRQLYSSFSFIHVLDPDSRERILDRIAGIVGDKLGGRATSVVVTSLFAASQAL